MLNHYPTDDIRPNPGSIKPTQDSQDRKLLADLGSDLHRLQNALNLGCDAFSKIIGINPDRLLDFIDGTRINLIDARLAVAHLRDSDVVSKACIDHPDKFPVLVDFVNRWSAPNSY